MWQGGIRSIDDSFYRRPAWKKCRAAFISHRQSVDGGLCQRCGETTGYIVHHRTPLTAETVRDPDVAYGFWNLEYVCKNCHDIEHGYKRERIGVKYSFDADGNPVAESASPR